VVTVRIAATRTARTRLAAAAVAGLATGGAAAWFEAWAVSALIGWCVAASVFLLAVWPTILRADAPRTKQIATREDDSRVATDLVLVSASVISLIGVGFVLLEAGASKGLAAAAITGLAVAAVVLAWATVHTVFTLRYAHLYWSAGGGVDFNDDRDPDYHDFAYLAFTIGMTYQVSDTDLTSKAIRRAALRHALLSFLFGTSIIAMTINVVAGLAK
jgi:uncharacterized membrane protein